MSSPNGAVSDTNSSGSVPDRNYAVEVQVPGAKIDLSEQLAPVWEVMHNLQQQLHQVEQLCVSKVSHPELQRLSLEVQQTSCMVERNNQKALQQGNLVDKLQMDVQRFNASVENVEEHFQSLQKDMQKLVASTDARLNGKADNKDVEKANQELQKLAGALDATATIHDLQQISKVLDMKANQEEMQQLTAIISCTDQELIKITAALDINWKKIQQVQAVLETHQNNVEQNLDSHSQKIQALSAPLESTKAIKERLTILETQHNQVEQNRQSVQENHQGLENSISELFLKVSELFVKVEKNFKAGQQEVDQVSASLDRTKIDLQQIVTSLNAKAGQQEVQQISKCLEEFQCINRAALDEKVSRQEYMTVVEEKVRQEYIASLDDKVGRQEYLAALDEKVSRQEYMDALVEKVSREEYAAGIADTVSHPALQEVVKAVEHNQKEVEELAEAIGQKIHHHMSHSMGSLDGKANQEEVQDLSENMDRTAQEVEKLTALLDVRTKQHGSLAEEMTGVKAAISMTEKRHEGLAAKVKELVSTAESMQSMVQEKVQSIGVAMQDIIQETRKKATIEDVQRLPAVVDDKVNGAVMDRMEMIRDELAKTSQQGIELARTSQHSMECLTSSTAAALEDSQQRLEDAQKRIEQLAAVHFQDHQELEKLAASVESLASAFSKSQEEQLPSSSFLTASAPQQLPVTKSSQEIPITLMRKSVSIDQLSRCSSTSPGPRPISVQPQRPPGSMKQFAPSQRSPRGSMGMSTKQSAPPPQTQAYVMTPVTSAIDQKSPRSWPTAFKTNSGGQAQQPQRLERA